MSQALNGLKVVWRRTGASVLALVVLLTVAALWRGGVGWLGDWWDLLRIGLVFATIVVFLHRKWGVGPALFAGTGVLLLLFPLRGLGEAPSPRDVVLETTGSLLRQAALLTLVVYLINILGSLLTARRGLSRLISALAHLVGDIRMVGAIVPSTIGLLPTPGGAMISAPVLREMGDTVDMDPETRTLCNYWFRHVWEFWWPLFPAVIYLLSPEEEEMAVSLADFFKLQFPLSVAAIAAGWYFIIRKIPRAEHTESGTNTWRNLMTVAGTLWPVAFVAVGVTFATHEAIALVDKDYKLELFAGILVAVCVALAVIKRVPGSPLLHMVKRACTLKMGVLVFGVFALRGAFDLTQAAGDLPELLTAHHIPEQIACFIVPWIVGMLTGYTFAGVGSTFPLLHGLLVADGRAVLPLVALAYTGSFVGVLMSPTHLCLVLTREYFGAHLGRIYRRLVPMMLVVMAAIVGVWLVQRWWA